VKKTKELDYCKTKISTIAIISVLAISAIFVTLPAATAQESRTTYSFLGAVPNPVGVGQTVLFHVGIFENLATVNQGWEDLSITIERPDGETDTIDNIRTDATGGTGVVYTPTMTGTYYCQAHFPEQVLKWNIGGLFSALIPAGTIMLASESEVLELVVQEESIPYYPGQPLPSEYWTRPIDPQLREWSAVSGSWLWADGRGAYAVTGNDEAPETAHILWAKPLTWGGQAGGTMGDWGFSHGDAYEGKWDNRIIINGILVYSHRTSRGGDDPLYYTAVNLRTGEELWKQTLSSPEGDTLGILFGQNLKWAGYNHHAIYQYIWATTFSGRGSLTGTDWYAFDPYTGLWDFTVANVPPGTTVFDESTGWIYRVNLNWNTGEGYIWSMTDLIVRFGEEASNPGSWGPAGNNYARQGSGTRSAGRYETWDAAEVNETTGELTEDAQSAYIANFTFPNDLPGGGGAIRATSFGNRAQYTDVWSGKIFGLQFSYTDVKTWAISLESGQEGTLLFSKTWNAPADWESGQPQIAYETTSLTDGFAAIWSKWELQHYFFSTDDGSFMSGPTEPEYYMNMYGIVNLIWDGKFYSTGPGGYVYCYDPETADTLWTYIADDPYQEYLFANQWWQNIRFIADGKLYLCHEEHSAIEPIPRGAPWLVLDATTGEEIARADGLFRGHHWGGRAIIGDSIMVAYDTYDLRIYAVGKGPSATTVTASPKVATHGTSVIIEGTVTDVSPGTEDTEIQLRFPYGVPAVSDEDQSAWMLYVYKQIKSPDEASVRPDATGVTVKIEVVNPNNEYEMLGTTTSDVYGNWAYSFKPNVEGTYMIIATFEGSRAYYGSVATTYLTVDPAAEEAPSAEEIADATASKMPSYQAPEFPAYLTMDLVILVIAVVGVVIGIIAYMTVRKQK
jgi:hypothetical protein